MAGAIPTLPNADAFYSERDSRSGIETPLANLHPTRIGVAVPPEVVQANQGIELALFWTASIIRRMGRAFAPLILVSSREFRTSTSRLVGGEGLSVEQSLRQELRSADPFARIEWRDWSESTELYDAAALIWLGIPPLGIRANRTISIKANGWVAVVEEAPQTELALYAADFDAAPAAIVMAACIAASRLFFDAFSRATHNNVAIALDSYSSSVDPTIYNEWMTSGYTLPAAIPWKPGMGSKPTADSLMVISAGAIGGNLSRLLRDSYLSLNSAHVIDPDVFELSNLNRMIGVGIQDVGSSKASSASQSLRHIAGQVHTYQNSYEALNQPEFVGPFSSKGTAVVVGVDQVKSRLSAGSDWPWLLLNGSTGGSTFTTGVHFRHRGGCVGCWYGQDDAGYRATRTPMACVAGVAPGVLQLQPHAAYPFVSLAAVASLSAALARAIYVENWETFAGTVVSMGLRKPECMDVRRIDRSKRCLILCSEDPVKKWLEEGVDYE